MYLDFDVLFGSQTSFLHVVFPYHGRFMEIPDYFHGDLVGHGLVVA